MTDLERMFLDAPKEDRAMLALLLQISEKLDRIQQTLDIMQGSKLTVQGGAQDITVKRSSGLYKLTIKGVRGNGLGVTKCLHSCRGIDFTEAKRITDNLPYTFSELFSKDEMGRLGRLLEESGAIVTFAEV